MQTRDEIVVVNASRFIDIPFLIGKYDLVVRDFDFGELFLLRHRHKRSVIDFPDLYLIDPRHQEQVEKQDNDKRDPIIEKQRFFRFFYFIHGKDTSLSSKFFSALAEHRTRIIYCKIYVYYITKQRNKQPLENISFQTVKISSVRNEDLPSEPRLSAKRQRKAAGDILFPPRYVFL